MAAAEAERQRVAAAEAERQRVAAAEAECQRVAAAEAERQKMAAAEAECQRVAAADLERRREFRGLHCHDAFSIGNGQAADQMMRRSNSLKTVTQLTLLGEGFFMARENGNSFWSQLPGALRSELVTRGLNTQGAVKYMAGGPHGQYYAQAGTTLLWSGTCSDSFSEAIRERPRGRSISRVAFGPQYSWIILYTDGSSAWEGIPTRLHNKLRSRNPRLSKPVEVALGQNETWYVKFEDGRYDYCLPVDVKREFEEWREAGWQVKNVLLNSENGDWLFRYS